MLADIEENVSEIKITLAEKPDNQQFFRVRVGGRILEWTMVTAHHLNEN